MHEGRAQGHAEIFAKLRELYDERMECIDRATLDRYMPEGRLPAPPVEAPQGREGEAKPVLLCMFPHPDGFACFLPRGHVSFCETPGRTLFNGVNRP